jgi:hypothetical protein
MARAFEEQATQAAMAALSFEERFSMLVDRESVSTPVEFSPESSK